MLPCNITHLSSELAVDVTLEDGRNGVIDISQDGTAETHS